MPSWLVWPGTSTTVFAAGAIVNGAVAGPVKVIVCGESSASSTMVTFAVRVPTATRLEGYGDGAIRADGNCCGA